MKKSKKQRYENMISINFYPDEIELLIKFCNYAMGFCEERSLENYKKAEQWGRNFNLILKNFNEEEAK
jgi:hypothetical protein